MNITEEELAKKIVQHIINDLGALESTHVLQWKIEPFHRHEYYKDWVKIVYKLIKEANSQGDFFIGYFDGSAKPNPGMMKIGGYIKNPKDLGPPIYKFSADVGEGTNNQAEYLALIKLVEVAIEQGIKRIKIFGDSLLAVSQVNGVWQANKKMAPLRDRARELLENFSEYDLSHVSREENMKADLLTR